ncbi:unnamed protein product [Paramecium primaurelia]|uniref:Uncharacterized protein n=1 Tax=Paramecium primaurelia TaxID=5886 RepID=A0A8S1KBP1_PARPR|nr:unnamed protein product [Paramecium primaurelia]
MQILVDQIKKEILIGSWAELGVSFGDYQQVIQNGDYKNRQNVGGSQYDEGVQISWTELIDWLKDYSKITFAV